tara:strand:+ start:56 stop:265 length:210 start_codon:yes stop_codon:yes gene_type:complete
MIIIQSQTSENQWGSPKEWTMNEVLEEINRDHSDKWIDYDKSDWLEGWMAWVEGDYHKLKCWPIYGETI